MGVFFFKQEVLFSNFKKLWASLLILTCFLHTETRQAASGFIRLWDFSLSAINASWGVHERVRVQSNKHSQLHANGDPLQEKDTKEEEVGGLPRSEQVLLWWEDYDGQADRGFLPHPCPNSCNLWTFFLLWVSNIKIVHLLWAHICHLLDMIVD